MSCSNSKREFANGPQKRSRKPLRYTFIQLGHIFVGLSITILQEYEEEEKQKRLGPGGLDPQDVYNELPEELRNCFDSRDVKLLQETISKMDEEEAKYHMKRCVDSGLWVPEANKKDADEGSDAENAEDVSAD